MKKLLLSISDAARRVGIGRDTAYELVRSGEWESVQVGRIRKVPLAFIENKYGKKASE